MSYAEKDSESSEEEEEEDSDDDFESKIFQREKTDTK